MRTTIRSYVDASELERREDSSGRRVEVQLARSCSCPRHPASTPSCQRCRSHAGPGQSPPCRRRSDAGVARPPSSSTPCDEDQALMTAAGLTGRSIVLSRSPATRACSALARSALPRSASRRSGRSGPDRLAEPKDDRQPPAAGPTTTTSMPNSTRRRRRRRPLQPCTTAPRSRQPDVLRGIFEDARATAAAPVRSSSSSPIAGRCVVDPSHGRSSPAHSHSAWAGRTASPPHTQDDVTLISAQAPH